MPAWFFMLMIVLQIVSVISVLILCVKYIRLKEQRDNEYYTDYEHGAKVILRVFKNEFEYQAIGNLPKNWVILDAGQLSAYHRWALIQKPQK